MILFDDNVGSQWFWPHFQFMADEKWLRRLSMPS